MSRPARPGLWYCRGCGDQFTVTEGTIMEHSHIPLDKWLLAIYLLSTIKVGISAHRLHRTLGITYKSAWFLVHRIRYALAQEPFASKMKERGNARLRTLSFPKPGCFEHNVRDLLVVKPSLRPK